MAEYIKRPAEVFKYVLDFVAFTLADSEKPPEIGLDKTLTPTEADQPNIAAGQERSHFLNQVPNYFVARNRHMNEMVDAMEVLSSSDDDLTGKWKQPLDSLVSDAQSTLGAILSGLDNRSPRAVALKWKIQAEEDLFVKQLMGLPVAAKWNALRTMHRQLINQIASLRARWIAVKSKAQEINASEMDMVKRIDDQLHSAWESGKGYYSTAFAAVDDSRNRVDAIAAAGSLTESSVRSGLEDAADLMNKASSPFSSMNGNYVEAMANLKAGLSALDGLQSAELTGVHRVFKDIRAEVADYVREPVSNRAKALQADAESVLASWVSSINQGPGMKSDADDFQQDLARKPDLGLAVILENYATFEKENKGRFYEDLTGDILADLLLQDNWNDHAKWLLSSEASDHPNAFELSIGVYFSVPIEKSYNDLIAAVPGQSDASIQESLKFMIAKSRDQVLSQYRTSTDSLRSVLRGLYDLMKSQEFRKYFERTNVLSSLKS